MSHQKLISWDRRSQHWRQCSDFPSLRPTLRKGTVDWCMAFFLHVCSMLMQWGWWDHIRHHVKLWTTPSGRQGLIAAKKIKNNLLAAVLILTVIPPSIQVGLPVIEHCCFLISQKLLDSNEVCLVLSSSRLFSNFRRCHSLLLIARRLWSWHQHQQMSCFLSAHAY
jgi:hypothetical protein